MGRTTLSHRAFRQNRSACPPSSEHSLEHVTSHLSSTSLTITRRQAIALAGTVALASTAGVKKVVSSLSPTEVTADRHVFRAVVAGRIFEIDSRRFGGSPRLFVTRGESSVTVSLRSATYPGTDIPADFTLRFDSLGGGTRLGIRSAIGGFDATVPLLAWLEGRASARSELRLSGADSDLADGRLLRFADTALATLHPDLTLELVGDDIVSLSGPGVSITGNEMQVWLASSCAPTLFTHRIKRRTFLEILRTDHEWAVDDVVISEDSTVAFDADSFDRLTIEAAETLNGRRLAIVQAENSRQAGGAHLRLASFGPKAGTFTSLPLGNPRYAFVCGDHDRFSLSAEMSDATSWLDRPGYSLLLGRDPTHPLLVMQGSKGITEQIEGETQVLGVAVPMDGVIASPLMFAPAHPPAADGDAAGHMSALEQAPQTLSLGGTLPSWFIPLPIYFALDAASITLTRPEDMLSLTFEFYNLQLELDHEVPRLARRDPDNPSYLVVELPPQALLEQAYYAETGSASAAMQSFFHWGFINPKTPPIHARIADPTRLAFRIPDIVFEEGGIPYTLEGLLDWSKYSNSVVPLALEAPLQLAPGLGSYPVLPPADTTPRPPRRGTHYPLVAPETSIEAPWGLYLSPSPGREYWRHNIQPVERAGVFGLWHTTLTGKPYWSPAGWTTSRPGVRAVWARHYSTDPGRLGNVPALFRNSFTTDVDDQSGHVNRWALVDITARYRHTRVNAERLTLTTLGAWLDLRGQWPVTDYNKAGEEIATALEAWTHRATMGRDQFVRIVKAGRLFPFGHRASHVTITERKFQNAPDGKRTAYLIQRSFIMVREFEKAYSLSDTGQGQIYRACPFKRVTLKTHITPDLADPTTTRVPGAKKSFWPRLLSTGQDFFFDYTATDWDGHDVDISSPLIFVPEDYATKWAGIDPVDALQDIAACDEAMGKVYIPLGGQKIAYSEPLPSSAEEDRRMLETQGIRLGARSAVGMPWAASWGDIHFHPKLHRAHVRLEDVEALMSANSDTWIRLWDGYLANGYTAINAEGRVFAEISDSGLTEGMSTASAASLPLEISPERAGGFATPNLSVTGLSATGGPFGGTPDNYGSGSLDALDFFSNANPTLFGDITLLDILSMANGTGISLGTKDVPAFNDWVYQSNGETIARYEYKWVTEKFGDKSAIFKQSTSPQTRLELLAFLEKSLSRADAPPSSGVNGTLTNFTLSLFSIIDVEFSSFGFSIDAGGDVDVTPRIKDIKFREELEFVNQLREVMNFGKGSGSGAKAASEDDDAAGFAIDINAEGLSAILTIGIPDLALGVFSLKNMSISVGFILPFTGEPLRFPFAFSKPESPFELAVSGFGGGGYFIVELQASDDNAITLLELSLEFGVCASVTLAGIASGSVEIKGGVMIRIAGDALTFVAFFRMAGRLDILGIIKVSVLFSLTLTYMNKDAAKLAGEGSGLTAILIGEASLSIEIEILFFSFGVTLTVKKAFEGDDPRFGDWMLEDEWATYCEAFGPATVGA